MTMQNTKAQRFDRHGNLIEDDDQIMQDGDFIRSSVMFMDGKTAPQQVTDNGQAAYRERMANAWRNPGSLSVADHDKQPIRQPSKPTATCYDAATKAMLADMKAYDDEVQRWADYFAGVEDASRDSARARDNGQAEYRERMANAWKNAR